MGESTMNRLGELSICILLWLIFVRLTALLISFGFAFRQSIPEQHQTPSAWTNIFFREFCATLLAFTLLIPLQIIFAPRRASKRLAAKSTFKTETVILLVHGLLSNSGIWWLFSKRLKEKLIGNLTHISFDSLNLGNPVASLDTYVKVLDQRISALKKNKNIRIILIGHSMGGLVCRAWLGANNDQQIQRLITLGTPHRGSQCAKVMRFSNLNQMRPGSQWLNNLPIQPMVATTAIYSVHDNFVVPFTAGFSPAFDSIQIVGAGHLGLLFDQQVVYKVATLLKADLA
jgi:triacylglycerol lipase